ncbi:transmembrane protein 147 [Cimex lectularius]|uniref:BOS complex subunit TMEM147 n=1 Tax=Cimex lectularius TaxID=79782 RepID=A0A8I6SBG7_CIMLE|nr:transmembrane protein 147 [Cimex lectularius]
MTLYHFGNCLALVYIPYHLTYKYSGLSEYGAFWKCIQAGGIYILTQLCKMLLLATFFPTAETNIHGQVDVLGEWLKATVDLADLAGMYLVLSSIPGKGHAKLLTAGLGWAGAEAILTHFLPLWVGARGAEFHWKYIQKSLDSNISLVQHITTCALVWIWSRHDLSKSIFPVVSGMLVLSSYKTLLIDLVVEATMDTWTFLLLKAVYTLCLTLPTLKIYAGLATSIGFF